MVQITELSDKGRAQSWERQRIEARKRHRANAERWMAENGIRRFDGRAFRRARTEAIARERERRIERWRRAGDAQIRLRIRIACERGASAAIPVTPAMCDVVSALLAMARGTCLVWASSRTIARSAGRSRRTACWALAALEEAGCLRRIESGGMRTDGARRTNLYSLDHQRMRQVLGIRCERASRYDAPAGPAGSFAASAPDMLRRARAVSRGRRAHTADAYWSGDGFSRGRHRAGRLEKMRKGRKMADEQGVCTLYSPKGYKGPITAAVSRQSRNARPEPCPEPDVAALMAAVDPRAAAILRTAASSSRAGRDWAREGLDRALACGRGGIDPVRYLERWAALGQRRCPVPRRGRTARIAGMEAPDGPR